MYNVWNKWDKLEAVLIGSCHPLEFYDNIKNDKIRDPLLRITEETLQELDYFKSVLKDFGCEVIQAPTVYDRIDRWGGDVSTRALPRSSLQPRDYQVVVGNKCVISYFDNMGIVDTLKEYNVKDLIIDPQIIKTIMGTSDEGSTSMGKVSIELTPEGKKLYTGDAIWQPTCVTVVGNRIYLDTEEMVSEKNIKWIKNKFPDFEYVEVSIGGHNDSCFTTLKPGVILSLNDIQTYEETFPGWDVCYLPDQSWSKVEKWSTIKRKTHGKWWVPGEEHNDAFTEFVNTWLSEWVGYVEETVFDVNCLVLDEHHVCVSNNKNETVNAFLKKHKMEPVHIPWRHRYFWDGGLHCITLDLKREGRQQDYFPL